jgi:uncharacterized membrane protein
MKIHEVKIYQEFDAPVEQVWDAFNDHANFGKMMGQNIKRIKDSTDRANINGLGSVRLISLPVMNFEETITKSEKPRTIEYQITRGTPLNFHYGTMQFSSLSDHKSAIHYSIKLGSKIPLLGGLVAAALQKSLADGIKKYAGRIKS